MKVTVCYVSVESFDTEVEDYFEELKGQGTDNTDLSEELYQEIVDLARYEGISADDIVEILDSNTGETFWEN